MNIQAMTDLLEHAIEVARALPPDMQDDFARLLLQLAGEGESANILTAEEEADLTAADAEASRGEFATAEHTLTALRQIDETLDYITERLPQGVVSMRKRIVAAFGA